MERKTLTGNYKDLVQKITDLSWHTASPADIILLSRCTAMEFASSLRLAKKLYQNDERLAGMMRGELETDNMTFDDYRKHGDHWEFLDHFISKHNIRASKSSLGDTMIEYTKSVDGFSDVDRAMTVFSREEELTSIFEKIITAHDWDLLGYGFYKYYLKQHIFFDSGEQGHAWLTQHFPLHELTLEDFYSIRLKLYSTLFS